MDPEIEEQLIYDISDALAIYPAYRLVSADFDMNRGFQIIYDDYYLLFDFWVVQTTTWDDLQKGLLLLLGLVRTPPPQGPGDKGFCFGIFRESNFLPLIRGEIGRIVAGQNVKNVDGEGPDVIGNGTLSSPEAALQLASW